MSPRQFPPKPYPSGGPRAQTESCRQRRQDAANTSEIARTSSVVELTKRATTLDSRGRKSTDRAGFATRPRPKRDIGYCACPMILGLTPTGPGSPARHAGVTASLQMGATRKDGCILPIAQDAPEAAGSDRIMPSDPLPPAAGRGPPGGVRASEQDWRRDRRENGKVVMTGTHG